jgi:hypothetical protein
VGTSDVTQLWQENVGTSENVLLCACTHTNATERHDQMGADIYGRGEVGGWTSTPPRAHIHHP